MRVLASKTVCFRSLFDPYLFLSFTFCALSVHGLPLQGGSGGSQAADEVHLENYSKKIKSNLEIIYSTYYYHISHQYNS